MKKFLVVFWCCSVQAIPEYLEPMLKKLLPVAPVILEAGGHVGEDTVLFTTVWPEATVYTFEPLPSSFEQLAKTTAGLAYIHCYHMALSDHVGSIDFYVNDGNGGASSIGKPLVQMNAHSFAQQPIQVPCTTIDLWAQEQGVTKIDFMWLDMEGHELAALRHAATVLSNVSVIYAEINLTEIREGACLYEELKAFLATQGFYEYWKKIESSVQGNALFVKL